MAGPKEITSDVRWGLMDAALSVVSPRSAARRYAARVAISNLRRGYEAASRGRGTAGWKVGGTAADAEIAAEAHADFALLADAEDEARAREADFLAWYVAGAGAVPAQDADADAGAPDAAH